MKAGWKTVKLGDVARYDKIQGIHSGLPYVGLEHIESGTRKFIGSRSDMEVQSSSFLFNPDHVLYGRLRPYLRKVLVPDFAGHCSTEIFPILPSSDLDRSYLSYWLIAESTTRAIDRLCNGARMPRANMEQALELEIPLPPLAEQKRIVALLDEAFAGIDEAKMKAEANMDEAKAVLQSHLESVFEKGGPDWVKEPLSECLDLITYGFTNPMPTTTEGPYMITAKNIVGGRIDYEFSRRTSQQAFDSLLTDKSRPIVGDVLLTKDGTLGRVAVVDRPDICVNQSVAVLRMNGKVFPPFMRDLLSSYGYQKRMIEDAGGTTIKHIYITRVDKMPVKFPASITEQKKLVDALEMAATEAQKLFNVFEKKVSAYGQLKNSLLAQAFAGELTA